MTVITGKVTRNGQITIPTPIRDALQLEPGDTIAFVIEDDRVYLRFIDPDPISPEEADTINKGIEQLLRRGVVEYKPGTYRD